MAMRRLTSFEDLRLAIGEDLGVSEWLLIDQTRVDAFGAAIDDRQWIHCDPERCRRESPFGGTIAHGALTLSLLSVLRERMVDVLVDLPARMGVLYGFNKVRFISPVRVGSRIRLRLGIKDAALVAPKVVQIIYEQTVEIEGDVRPALVAETVNRQYLA
jgi:acyl dehydratase